MKFLCENVLTLLRRIFYGATVKGDSSMKAKTKPESKRARFVRLAEARTNKIISMLRLLGNCSSPVTYEYTPADIKKIFKAIEDATSDAKRRFTNHEGGGNKPFTLG